MSFFGVPKEFSDINTPKTSIRASGPGYPQKNRSGFYFVCRRH